MRREELYLEDIIEACDDIAEFIVGVEQGGFLENKLLCSAVLQKLIVIGEAAARLPEELKASHPEIEWGDVVGIRNRIVHGYFRVDWEIIWTAAVKEVPALRQQVARMVSEERG